MAKKPAHHPAVNDWNAVWRAIDERRVALGWSKTYLYEATSTSEGTYRKMQDGVGLTRRDKIVAICLAIGWTADSIDRILAGEPPTVEPVNRPDVDEGARIQIDAALAALDASLTHLEGRVARREHQLDLLQRRLDALEQRPAPRAARPVR